VYNVDISDRALEDSRRIITYITEDLEMPKAAASLFEKLDACYERLENNPHMYALCPEPRLRKEGFHRAIVKNYILLFKIFEDRNIVWVYRIFHSSQDYTNLV
jgi:plasmid stabilization system protein ParE